MKIQKLLTNKLACCLFIALFAVSCTPGTSLLNRIPIHSIQVKVEDMNGNPVPGAEVSASNGRASTTNEKGIAKVKFGAVGVYDISVMADNYMASNFVVTMPTDDKKVFTRQISAVPTFSHLRYGMNIYPFLYNYLLSSFGYSVIQEPYKESQYTVWQMSDPEDEGSILTIHKAYLKKNDKGQQWWRIIITNNGDDESKYVAEILFSKDHSRILRYRDQIDGGKIQEKPVSKDWYSKPIELTEESKEGATVKKNISVKTPAGTFTADLLKFGPTPGSTLKIWDSNEVPGGVVKYVALSDDDVVMKSVLKASGSGAKTMLDSY